MDFESMKNKAGEMLNEHDDKVDSALEQAGEFAKEKFGHGEQIDQAVGRAQEYTGGRDSAGPAQEQGGFEGGQDQGCYSERQQEQAGGYGQEGGYGQQEGDYGRG